LIIPVTFLRGAPSGLVRNLATKWEEQCRRHQGGPAAIARRGAEPLQDVTDVGGGWLIAIVKEADANMIGLLQDA
jgi:hypothetical protein